MYCEKQEFYGHTNGSLDKKSWQPLKEHLQNVANLTKKFAGKFNESNWGYIADSWHDFGRYSAEFQKSTNTVDGEKAHIEVIGKVKCLTVGAKHAH